MTGQVVNLEKYPLTDAEKCEIFDRIRNICAEQALDHMTQRGDDDLSDGKQFIYEEAMRLTLGQDIFTVLNKYR